MSSHIVLKDADMWEAIGTDSGIRWRCLACRDGRARELKHCPQHEESEKHKAAIQYMRSLNSSHQNDSDDDNMDGDNEYDDNYGDIDADADVELYNDDSLATAVDSYADDTSEGDDEMMGISGYTIESTEEEELIRRMTSTLTNYSIQGSSYDMDAYSDDNEYERDSSSSDDESSPDTSGAGIRLSRSWDVSSDWFPWPDKVSCIIDIMHHLPRSTFSDRQHGMIVWVLQSLGVALVPGESSIKNMMKALQFACGVRTKRYPGALGHDYYLNDILAIISEEMANPLVRPNIHFYPELADCIENAFQAHRWLYEFDPTLMTPMFRDRIQDYYVFEICLLNNNTYCIPVRWFVKDNVMHAHAWRIYSTGMQVEGRTEFGWVVQAFNRITISASSLQVSFPYLVQSYMQRGVPDPRTIFGIILKDGGPMSEWSFTDASVGNRWRTLAQGHRVLAFPIWLYCDDTSGNSSKRWNKHNSYLFTAAGLTHNQVHLDYNVHFICTSNLATPLEMFEGIAEQINHGQRHGVWAWDCVFQDAVLVIPSVFALLGDNPMQSELSSHVGLNGNQPCRVCCVVNKEKEDTARNEVVGDTASNARHDSDGNVSDGSTVTNSGPAQPPVSGAAKSNPATDPAAKSGGRKGKKKMSMGEYVEFASRLIRIDVLRNKNTTERNLREIYDASCTVGRQTFAKQLKTKYGAKDAYQEYFTDKIIDYSRSLKSTVNSGIRQEHLDAFVATLPSNFSNPVWSLRGLDAHLDTPVEVLHTILLGFVKYFWRDAVDRTKVSDHEIMAVRLSSLDVSGLGLDTSGLIGKTLVQYAGSLVGRDFRVVVQVAPFVLYNLVPPECYKAWLALVALVPLVWQQSIDNFDDHLKKITDRIDHLLNCVADWSPRWFNKPKFHILLHLPMHIRRFGPPSLFATEAFESYNAVIRDLSIHSNRQAPSRDIGVGFASTNRIRHLLSGGKFRMGSLKYKKSKETGYPDHSNISILDNMKEIGPEVKSLLVNDLYLQKFFTPRRTAKKLPRVTVDSAQKKIQWNRTASSHTISREDSEKAQLAFYQYTLCKEFTIKNGESCPLYKWVVFDHSRHGKKCIGQVIEILQVIGSQEAQDNIPNFVLVAEYTTKFISPVYGMPVLAETGIKLLVNYKDILCMANVQHNCASHNCPIRNIRKVQQERVELNTLAPGVEHHNINDIVLNTAKMHDSQIIQIFFQEIHEINRDVAIHRGAAREIAIQRQKMQKANDKDSQAIQQVINPIQSAAAGEASGSPRGGRGRGRGNHRGRGRGQTRGGVGSNLSGPSILPDQ